MLSSSKTKSRYCFEYSIGVSEPSRQTINLLSELVSDGCRKPCWTFDGDVKACSRDNYHVGECE